VNVRFIVGMHVFGRFLDRGSIAVWAAVIRVLRAFVVDVLDDELLLIDRLTWLAWWTLNDCPNHSSFGSASQLTIVL